MAKKTNYLSEITPFHLNELLTNGLSIDHVYVLELVGKDIDVEYFFQENEPGLVILQNLTRKGYIKNNQLTELATKLLEFVQTEPEKKLRLKKRTTIPNDDFEKFWLSYPATDNVVKDGKILYSGTRALRKGKKDEIRIKLEKVLAEGKYTLDEIINAVRFEYNQKVNESIKSRENKLKYMQNIDTYMNQRSYEAYIEVAKLATTFNERPKTFITDI